MTTPNKSEPSEKAVALHPAGSAWRPALEYASKSGAWWKGRRVRVLREIKTRGGDVCRKHRILKVERKYGGLTLKGARFYVTYVGYYGLEVDTTPNDKAH